MAAERQPRAVETNKAIPPAKLAHFVLRTRDLEATKKWWTTLLGAHVVEGVGLRGPILGSPDLELISLGSHEQLTGW